MPIQINAEKCSDPEIIMMADKDKNKDGLTEVSSDEEEWKEAEGMMEEINRDKPSSSAKEKQTNSREEKEDEEIGEVHNTETEVKSNSNSNSHPFLKDTENLTDDEDESPHKENHVGVVEMEKSGDELQTEKKNLIEEDGNQETPEEAIEDIEEDAADKSSDAADPLMNEINENSLEKTPSEDKLEEVTEEESDPETHKSKETNILEINENSPEEIGGEELEKENEKKNLAEMVDEDKDIEGIDKNKSSISDPDLVNEDEDAEGKNVEKPEGAMEIDEDKSTNRVDLPADEKENVVDKKAEDKREEVISISDDESDEGEGVGAIRIRDFNSLMEEPDEEDDDVVEITRPNTLRVLLDDNPELAKEMELNLECGDGDTYDNNERMQKFNFVKRKLMELQNHVKEMPGGGLRVVKGSEMIQNTGLNMGRFSTSIRGYSPISQGGTRPPSCYSMANSSNPVRLNNAAHTPISIVRGRNSLPANNGKTMGIMNPGNAGNSKQMTLVGMNNGAALTQLIFDPATGLLLCPSPGGGNTMQALRPSSQALQTIQNASQIAANRYNVALARTATGQQTTAQNSVTGTTTNVSGSGYDPSRVPISGLRTVPTPTGTAIRPMTYQSIAPAPLSAPANMRPPASASFLPPTNRPIRPPGVVPTPVRSTGASSNQVRFATARTIAAIRNKEPYIRPAVAPTASATVKLLNQQKLAAANAATATNPTSTANKPEEVTAGSLQAVAAPDKDPHNSKTFPSLVVMVKPCLQDKLTKQQQQAARSELDVRVKTILMYTPSRFTEWLMQKGLLRVEHRCTVHGIVPYKLGMYSDGASKQPFSGGYVWISDCCPDKQVSVFQGSIFEASVYPPGTLMKLIYHWSCQTPATNALQWVKVTSYYLKNFYTLLRSACVAGLHQNCKVMGGQGKYIEIGIITLGTTVASTAGQQKQVKIEILGVFDPSSKSIRMKVINPQNVGVTDANNERIRQIVYPLNHWVDKKSVILIDTSMDKSLLEEMGFSAVSQSQGGAQNHAQKSATPTNVNVMNYLKNVVPKMFQNTLCVLSKSLIQQFLDELSWREIWGGNPSTAFDNIILHLVQMTLAETGENLISRLNKISLNPFAEWSFGEKAASSGIECLPDSIRGGPDLVSSVSSSVTDYPNLDGIGELAANYMRNRTGPTKTIQYGNTNSRTQSSQQPNGNAVALKRKFETSSASVSDLTKHLMAATSKGLTLQTYYYVWVASTISSKVLRGDFPLNLKCPLCSKLFVSNHDAMRHIMIHVVNVGRSSLTQAICNYCLKELSPAHSLQAHINESHKLVDILYCCRICNEKFASDQSLVLHMWQHHVECECPYRCEVCDFRSSYHYEVIDHFHKEHSGLDCVQCPVCLRVLGAKSFACLKILVVHLQNHMIKKGRKCLDCCLVFVNDQDYRAHMALDRAHESRAKLDHKRHKVLGEPILMSKPPLVSRAKLPPPAKKSRTEPKKSATNTNPSVTTLNSELAIPINPAEKFAYDRYPVLVMGLGKGLSKCWECDRDMTLAFHYTGTMKCTKCKYYTHCPVAMTKHTQLHQPRTGVRIYGPQCPKPMEGDEDLWCGCGFHSRYPDKLALHLIMCDRKIVHPLRENEERDEDEGPPVLLQQELPIS